MTVSFDTLSFAKRLTEAGEKPAVAEAHAMALKEFVMETIAAKADVRELRTEIEDVRDEIQDLRGELRSEMQSVRGEIQDFRKEVEERFATKHELRHEIGLLRKDIDAMGLKLTVRMGGMLAVAVGAVAALGKVL
jgi:predicted  nucleic acid-binding Zn-ribbon protein